MTRRHPLILVAASMFSLAGTLTAAQAAQTAPVPPPTRSPYLVASTPDSAPPVCDKRTGQPQDLDRFARGRDGRPETGQEVLCDPAFRHPLQALAGARATGGALPLFDQLNDPSGRRYVVGEELTSTSERGTGTMQSGLYAVGRQANDPSRKSDPPPDLTPAPKIGPDLRAAIDRSAGAPVDVIVTVLAPDGGGLLPKLERKIAAGDIRTQRDYDAARDQLVAQQSAVNGRTVGAVAAAVETGGGRVPFRCQMIGCLIATLDGDGIEALARRADVLLLDIIREPEEASLTGTEVRTGTQLRQFQEGQLTFDGNGLNETAESDNIVAAVVEPNGFFADHDGFRENAGGAYRIDGRWECPPNQACESVSSFSAPGSHGTGAAGLLAGDLMDSQVPGVPAAEREWGTGYAPEARLHLYDFSNGVDAFDHIDALKSDQNVPDLVSNSWGFNEASRCSGISAMSSAANRLYKDGIAVFAAAHNNTGSASDCRVTTPGSAIGSFTMAAHIFIDSNAPTWDEEDANTIREAGIRPNSSWGGNLQQGQGRSIIDLSGPSNRQRLFNKAGGFSDFAITSTSHATPTVAGHAASFLDFYHARYGNFIDNPGSLYANMLLMGDRQGVNGKRVERADHRWGMGRLRMRMPDANGLDGPYQYFNGWTCVSDSETVEIPVMNGAALPADMNDLKAAAYWFDQRHDGSDGTGNAGKVADVDLAVVDATSDVELRSDLDSYDNKAGLYVQNVGGRRLNVELRGENVSGHDDPVCGNDAMRVFFAFFAEDSDREAPTYNSTAGTGVFPEFK